MSESKIFLSESNIELPKKNNSSWMEFSLKREKYITQFESTIENYLQNDTKAVGLSSGTACLHVALILAGVKEGDEVICQTFTFSASVFPILYQKAKPVFIDSEPNSWNICPDTLEEVIKDRISKNKKPKAIIFVNLYGMPAKIDRLVKIAKKYSIKLIEDAAEALGSSFQGRKCGTFGDFSIISFNRNKIITALGGGMLVCNKETDKRKAIFYSTQAKDKAPHYEHSNIGYNYRISEIVAYVGVQQMEKLEENVLSRRKVNHFYNEIFQDFKGVHVFQEPNEDYYSNHWLSCILIDSKESQFHREDLRLKLLENNIESRPLWKPMHLQPIFKKYSYYGNTVSEEFFKNGLCLPSGSNLSSKDEKRIKETIMSIILKG